MAQGPNRIAGKAADAGRVEPFAVMAQHGCANDQEAGDHHAARNGEVTHIRHPSGSWDRHRFARPSQIPAFAGMTG